MYGDYKSDKINILLIEDDDIDAEAIHRAFAKSNITNPVSRATCGQEALELLYGLNGRKKMPQPCIILVDLNMPRMNGFEFLCKVKEDPVLRKNSVFVLTTSAASDDICLSYEFSPVGYFLKENLDGFVDMLRLYRDINVFPLSSKLPV